MDDILQSIWEFLARNAAILIALFALLFTAYEVYDRRKHNRLSLKPHISSFMEKNFNFQGEKISITWTLVNHGLGPAVIKSYRVFLDGVPVDTGSPSEVLKAMVKAFGDANPTNFYMSHLSNDYMMRNDESKNFLVFEISASPLMKLLSELDEVDTRVERFKVEVKYASVDGEKFTFESGRT